MKKYIIPQFIISPLLGRGFSLMILSCFTIYASGQEEIKEPLIDNFSSSIEVTNNGIAIMPVFTVGVPAAIVNVKFSKKRFSVEPQIRFILEGKPWSMHFWLRYKAIQREKFKLRVGAHPALNWRTITAVTGGVEIDLLESRRYAAFELAPSYKISEKVGVGMYYFFLHGFDDGLENGHLLLTKLAFSKIPLGKKGYHISLAPQLYFLNLDKVLGSYAAAEVVLGKKDFPIKLIAVLNQKAASDIATKDFFWNLTLRYSFK